MKLDDLKKAERVDQHRRWLMANGGNVVGIPHAGEVPEGEQPSRWLVLIQNYAQQMTTPDNAIKIEVLAHLNSCIETCISAYLAERQSQIVADLEERLWQPEKAAHRAGIPIMARGKLVNGQWTHWYLATNPQWHTNGDSEYKIKE